jgi:hypothetical protein
VAQGPQFGHDVLGAPEPVLPPEHLRHGAEGAVERTPARRLDRDDRVGRVVDDRDGGLGEVAEEGDGAVGFEQPPEEVIEEILGGPGGILAGLPGGIGAGVHGGQQAAMPPLSLGFVSLIGFALILLGLKGLNHLFDYKP